MAGPRPERVKRDESGLYVVDFPRGREREMISRGGALPRVGRRYADSEAVDPIGVALSITAGERSHPRTGTPPLIRPHRGRTSCRGRADRGMPAGRRRLLRNNSRTFARLPTPPARRRPPPRHPSWPPIAAHYPYASFPQVRLWLTRGYRKFAPYGGAGLAVYLRPRRTYYRMGNPFTLSAPRLFNTQNRLFSSARSVARKYAKI